MLITIHTALPVSATAAAPEWLHLMPMGEFRGKDGRGPYRVEGKAHAEAIVAASKKLKLIPVDVNHSTQLNAPKGEESPARGWIVDFEVRDDGIYGRVEWTPAGAEMMAAKEYRGTSPVMRVDAKTGRVLAIISAALTNTPNLSDLHTHSQEPDMDLAALRTKLGLPETADIPAILAAIDAKDTVIAAHSQGDAKVTEMASTIVTLQTQLSTLEAESKKAAATTVIDAAIAAGKPINPLRDHFITRHMADPASVEKELAAMPSINGTKVVIQASGQGDPEGDELDADDKAVIEKMNLDPKAFAKMKKAQRMKGSA